MKDVARFYGYEPNRAGFLICPFHSEDTASLKLYENSFYCFGCHASGSIIDFVMQLYGLSFRDALVKLDNDFCLGIVGQPISEEAQHRYEKQRRAKIHKEADLEHSQKLWRRNVERYHELEEQMQHGVPDKNGCISDELAEAIKKWSQLDIWLDEHEYPGR